MPSVSKAQRRAMAIAAHDPDKLHAKNRGLAGLSLSALMEYARTPERGLPAHTKKKKR